jgi:hypothetical protein
MTVLPTQAHNHSVWLPFLSILRAKAIREAQGGLLKCRENGFVSMKLTKTFPRRQLCPSLENKGRPPFGSIYILGIPMDAINKLSIFTLCPSRAREALADPKTDASRTMDSHLHAVSGMSSCYPSSETKINLRKEVKSRSVTRRDEPLL